MSRTDPLPTAWWPRIRHWLESVPIDDPVDRRNAPVMQLLLLFLSVSIPLLWGYQTVRFGLPRGGLLALGCAAITTVVTLAGVVLIRRGHFRTAVRAYLATLLLTLLVTYLDSGFDLMSIGQADQFTALIVSGLVLGRRTIWLTFLALTLISIAGCVVDVQHLPAGVDPLRAFANLPSALLSYAIVALVLDRTVAALRETLAESNRRGAELQREMRERERMQARLLHAHKLDAAGKLASGVAHDFNHLLDIVLGFSRQRHEALDEADPKIARLRLAQSLEGVEAAANRGVGLTRKLLGFARDTPSRPQTFAVADALGEMQPLLRQLLPPTIRLQLETAAHVPPGHVHLDRAELELIVLNIAANARDAMPEGGTFSIHAGIRDDMVELSLRDDGKGMDAAVRARVFEPFFTTRGDGSGAGLGLSMVNDLVRAAGGDIEVESTPGAGTCLRLRLPSVQVPARRDQEAMAST